MRHQPRVRRPARQAAQHPVDQSPEPRAQSPEQDRHQRQHEQGGEHHVGLDARVGVQHDMAEPGGGADPLADHRAEWRDRCGDAEPRAERRQRRRQPHVAQLRQRTRIHGPREVEPARVGAPQPVRERGGDGEEDHRHHHLGRDAEAEPQHRQRRRREHRHRLRQQQQQHHQQQQQRHQPALQRARRHHAQRREGAHPPANHQPLHGLGERHQRAPGQQVALVPQRPRRRYRVRQQGGRHVADVGGGPHQTASSPSSVSSGRPWRFKRARPSACAAVGRASAAAPDRPAAAVSRPARRSAARGAPVRQTAPAADGRGGRPQAGHA